MQIREILENIDKADYFDKVNLHIHTKYSDGTLCEKSLLAKLEDKKLISVTDHNTLDFYNHIGINNKIISGVEFDCWYGYTLLHILGYGIDVNNKELKELCAQTKFEKEADIFRFFNNRKAKDVIKAIKNAGGVAVLAHPCCCWNVNIKNMFVELKTLGLEGLEVYYPYKRHRGFIKFYSVDYIEQIADEFGFIKTGGSDCHDDNF